MLRNEIRHPTMAATFNRDINAGRRGSWTRFSVPGSLACRDRSRGRRVGP